MSDAFEFDTYLRRREELAAEIATALLLPGPRVRAHVHEIDEWRESLVAWDEHPAATELELRGRIAAIERWSKELARWTQADAILEARERAERAAQAAREVEAACREEVEALRRRLGLTGWIGGPTRGGEGPRRSD